MDPKIIRTRDADETLEALSRFLDDDRVRIADVEKAGNAGAAFIRLRASGADADVGDEEP